MHPEYLEDARVSEDLALDRPDCAKIIGAITVAWSNLESSLAVIYTTLCVGLSGYMQREQAVVMDAFDAVKSFSDKQEMLLLVASKRLDQATYAELEGLLKKVWDAGQKRNKIVHRRWLVTDKLPDELIQVKRIPSLAEPKRYNVRMLTETFKSVKLRHTEMRNFYHSKVAPAAKLISDRLIQGVVGAEKLKHTRQG